MCLAIPAKVISIDASGEQAGVCVGGICKNVSLALVEDVQIGDYVLIHVGFALNKLSQEEAEITLKLFAEAGMLEPDSHEIY